MAGYTFIERAVHLQAMRAVAKHLIKVNDQTEDLFNIMRGAGLVTRADTVQLILDACGPYDTYTSIAYQLDLLNKFSNLWTYEAT